MKIKLFNFKKRKETLPETLLLMTADLLRVLPKKMLNIFSVDVQIKDFTHRKIVAATTIHPKALSQTG